MNDLIERLSDHVHQAWMAEKQRQGFADHTYEPSPYFEDEDGKAVHVGYTRRCRICVENAEVYLPKDTRGPLPVILMRSPYNGGCARLRGRVSTPAADLTLGRFGAGGE